MSVHSTNLRFNTEKETQRRAWEYLQGMDKQRFKSYSQVIPLVAHEALTTAYINDVDGLGVFLLLTAGTAYILFVSREVGGISRIISWIVYSTGIFLNLYFGYYNSFLRGVGAVDKANKNAVLSKLIQIALTVILLAFKTGIIGPCIAYLAYGTAFRQLGKRDFYNHQNIKEKLSTVKEKVTKTQVVEMLRVVWHNA